MLKYCLRSPSNKLIDKGDPLIPRLFAAVAIIFYLVAAQSPASAQKIRAASGGLSVIHSLLWAPYEQKLMKKYGVDMEYVAIESGTVGMQTLVANQSQFLFSTGSLAVNANLVGADITIVAGGLNFIPISNRPSRNQNPGRLQRQEDRDQPLRLLIRSKFTHLFGKTWSKT